jgi:hypothetical protein
MKKHIGYNPKRRIAPPDTLSADERHAFSASVNYGGNPEHKRSPADYGLTPPVQPRPGKTRCDGNRQILKEEATEILRNGLLKGMFSQCEASQWPKNIWSVSAMDEVFEAQLENVAQGTYHGYPLPENDDFRRVVKQEWKAR